MLRSKQATALWLATFALCYGLWRVACHLSSPGATPRKSVSAPIAYP